MAMMLDCPVKCSAIVDRLKMGRKPLWRVTVKGLPPHDQCRIYRLKALTDDHAAFEGIRRFVEEMGAPPDGRAGSTQPETPA